MWLLKSVLKVWIPPVSFSRWYIARFTHIDINKEDNNRESLPSFSLPGVPEVCSGSLSLAGWSASLVTSRWAHANAEIHDCGWQLWKRQTSGAWLAAMRLFLQNTVSVVGAMAKRTKHNLSLIKCCTLTFPYQPFIWCYYSCDSGVLSQISFAVQPKLSHYG